MENETWRVSPVGESVTALPVDPGLVLSTHFTHSQPPLSPAPGGLIPLYSHVHIPTQKPIVKNKKIKLKAKR